MTITATQVLEMLEKARQLSIQYEVYDDETSYRIRFYVDWHWEKTKKYSHEEVIISKDNKSLYSTCWDFDSFMIQLNVKLEEQKQKEIKAQKRKELIARLTDEEKELLGVK